MLLFLRCHTNLVYVGSLKVEKTYGRLTFIMTAKLRGDIICNENFGILVALQIYAGLFLFRL